MTNNNMICIACPLGCKMKIETVVNGSTDHIITGNKCPRGEQYAIKEMTNPTRMVTSTVLIENSHLPLLPVRTSGAIPKDKIFACMQVLDEVKVQGPVKMGDVVVENLLGLGIDIIASRSM